MDEIDAEGRFKPRSNEVRAILEAVLYVLTPDDEEFEKQIKDVLE